MSRRTQIAILVCLLLAAVLAIGLYVLGPRSETVFACSMCGREKLTRKRVGITYYSKESETDDSRWYQAKGLRPHLHDWQYVCSDEKGWGKGGVHLDGFGLFLYPLHLLRQAENKADATMIVELIEEYYATREDQSKIKHFVQHCKDIIGCDNTLDATGRSPADFPTAEPNR